MGWCGTSAKFGGRFHHLRVLMSPLKHATTVTEKIGRAQAVYASPELLLRVQQGPRNPS